MFSEKRTTTSTTTTTTTSTTSPTNENTTTTTTTTTTTSTTYDQAPEWIGQAWTALCESGSGKNQRKAEFITNAVNGANDGFSNPYFNKFRSLSKNTVEGTEQNP